MKLIKYLRDILAGPCYPLNCHCADCRSAKHRAEVAAVITIWLFFFGLIGLIIYMSFIRQPQ